MSTLKEVAKSNQSAYVLAVGQNIKSDIWFKTAPLTRTDCYRWVQLQLTTVSHDQGWVQDHTQGSWSWFEVSLMENEHATTPREKDGKMLSWVSHRNNL